MPDQSVHEQPENLVEEQGKKTHSATSLEEEANSGNSLEGYAAMNQPPDEERFERIEQPAKDPEKG